MKRVQCVVQGCVHCYCDDDADDNDDGDDDDDNDDYVCSAWCEGVLIVIVRMTMKRVQCVVQLQGCVDCYCDDDADDDDDDDEDVCSA